MDVNKSIIEGMVLENTFNEILNEGLFDNIKKKIKESKERRRKLEEEQRKLKEKQNQYFSELDDLIELNYDEIKKIATILKPEFDKITGEFYNDLKVDINYTMDCYAEGGSGSAYWYCYKRESPSDDARVLVMVGSGYPQKYWDSSYIDDTKAWNEFCQNMKTIMSNIKSNTKISKYAQSVHDEYIDDTFWIYIKLKDEYIKKG